MSVAAQAYLHPSACRCYKVGCPAPVVASVLPLPLPSRQSSRGTSILSMPPPQHNYSYMQLHHITTVHASCWLHHVLSSQPFTRLRAPPAWTHVITRLVCTPSGDSRLGRKHGVGDDCCAGHFCMPDHAVAGEAIQLLVSGVQLPGSGSHAGERVLRLPCLGSLITSMAHVVPHCSQTPDRAG